MRQAGSQRRGRRRAEDGLVHGQEVGYCTVPLDGTRASNRTRETNLGNWVADVWRLQAAADVALLNAGSLKIDEVCPEPCGLYWPAPGLDRLPPFPCLVGLHACCMCRAMRVEEIDGERGRDWYVSFRASFSMVP